MRHLARARVALVCLLTTILVACLPVTAATIRFGGKYGEPDLLKVEAVVETLGFSRIWVESASGGRYPRTEHQGEVMSGFETPIGTANAGFGISIHWKPADGSLWLIFAERNTRFSDRGLALMHQIGRAHV